MSKRIPVEWSDRARLRLKTPGEIVALYHGDTKLEPDRWHSDPVSGETMLFADPGNREVTAELKAEVPPRATAKSEKED